MQTICKERQYSKVHEEEWSVEKEPVSLENIDSHVVPASWAWIYVLSIANFGISAAWSLEFTLTTPYFEKGLGAGPVLSHAVWIVGPLSGLIVAPIVGSLSDRCNSTFGRRRPFILCGLFCSILGMITFPYAREIVALFITQGTDNHRIASQIFAIISFCLLDLAINTTMWPVRALQGDLIPLHQQHSLQSASIVMASFGDLSANGLVHYFSQPIKHIHVCFLVTAIIYTLTMMVVLIVGVEEPLQHDDESVEEAQPLSLNVLDYLRGLPPWLWRIGGTYALAFFALFCIVPNGSTWLGSSVLGGDPNALEHSKLGKLFEHGISIYGQASLTRACVQIVFSIVYPSLLKYVTPGQLFGMAYGGYGVFALFFSGTKSEIIAKVIIVALAFPQVATFTIPVGLTVENSDTSNRGRYLGALNCFAVIPQLVDTLYTGYISRAFGEAMVMRVGAFWAILTSIVAFLHMRV